jgi:hypothetical protein
MAHPPKPTFPVAEPNCRVGWRNAQQAAVEVEELLFRGYREVVDADLAELLKQPRPPPFTGTALGRLVAGETVVEVANIGDQPGLRCAGI